jgi:protein SCO1/2
MSESAISKSGSGSLIAVALALGLLAAVAGVWLGSGIFSGHRGPDPSTMQVATLLPTPKPLARFELVDQDARPYGTEDLKGRWTFIAIGYTSCPDVCPTTMATFDALHRRLTGEGGEPPADFLLVSVDPERDGPERLAQYVRYFNPDLLGATGTHEQLRALTDQLGMIYARVDEQETAMSYLVDHSASILLLDPQVRLTAIFSVPHDVSAMAGDFSAIAGNVQNIIPP